MQLSEFVSDLRARLGEATEGYWKDAFLKMTINYAIRYIERKTRMLRGNPRECDISSGYALYKISETFGGPNQVVKVSAYDSDGALHPLRFTRMDYLQFDNSEVDILTAGDPPIYWYACEEEESVGICPIPNYNYTDGLIIFPWIFSPELTADAHTPLLPSKCDDAILEFALLECAIKRGDKDQIIYRVGRSKDMLKELEQISSDMGHGVHPAEPNESAGLLV